MKFKNLGRPPSAVIDDAVAVFLIESIGVERPIGWYRLVLVQVARAAHVTGASIASLTMRSADELTVAIARVMSFVGDPGHAQQLLAKVVHALGEQAATVGVQNPPAPELTPMRQPAAPTL